MAAPMGIMRFCQLPSKLFSSRRISVLRSATSSYKHLSLPTIAIPHQISKYHNSQDGYQSREGQNVKAKIILSSPLAGILGFFKKKEEEDEDELKKYIRLARVAEHQNNFPRAEQMYHKALEVLKDRGMPTDSKDSEEKDSDKEFIEAQVHVYDSLANLALASGRLEDSEKLFKETMKGLLQLGYPKDDNAIIEISLKLAMIFVMQNRKEEAYAGYKYCIDTQEAKLKHEEYQDENSVALLGMCVNSYARFLIMETNYQEAEKALKRAVDLAHKVFGEIHPQIAVLLSDLATVSSLSKEHNTAKDYAEKALSIGHKVMTPDLAAMYCNACAVYMEAGEMIKAQRYCKEAVGLAKKVDDKETVTEAESYIKEIKEKLNK